jgi:hypothetical protein
LGSSSTRLLEGDPCLALVAQHGVVDPEVELDLGDQSFVAGALPGAGKERQGALELTELEGLLRLLEQGRGRRCGRGPAGEEGE